MMTDDLDTLRPEVREAAEEIDEILGSFGNEEWKAIRAELLRLAVRNAELEAKATRDHDWVSDLLSENKKAESELAALKDENAQLRDVLADRDMDRDMAAHANKELAALKARIDGSRHAFLGPNMDRITFLAEDIGPIGRYALVKVEE